MNLSFKKLFYGAFGEEMSNTIREIDKLLIEKHKTAEFKRIITIAQQIEVAFGKWEVYKLAFKEICEIELNFTRTDEYFGICTNDEEFLFKVERKLS